MPTNRQREIIQAAARQRERDGLAMFRALTPGQYDVPIDAPDQVELISCQATETLFRGGNRAGKSTVGAVRCACAARDIPFKDWGGNEYHVRPDYQRGQNLDMWIIGLQLNHIGQTIHRLLFRAGLYKIIKDLDTGLFRPFREWDEADRARRNECKPSPPLIPESAIKEWSWSRAAAREFDACHLWNGTSIYAFASTSDVKQGDPIDWIWIDERIAIPSHYDEWRARLIDKRGKMYWTSKPFAGNQAMMNLTEKAERQQTEVEEGTRSPDNVHVKEFRLRTSSNPALDAGSVAEFRESLSADALAVRDAGEYEIGNALIYPFFNAHAHSAIPNDRDFYDDIAQILRDNNGVPPNDWCHEIVLDPGSYKPAVLFGAIPPPELWPNKNAIAIAYDEIFGLGKKLDAQKIALMIKERTPAGRMYQRFIIDNHAARQTPMGFTGTVGQNYWKYIVSENIPRAQSAHFFIPGSDNIESRKQVVDQWLSLQDDGRPRIRIVTQNCPNLVWQMTNNYYRIDSMGNVDDTRAAPKQKDDVRNCLEYWLSRNPDYVAPPAALQSSTSRWDSHQQMINQYFNNGRQPQGSTIQIGGATIA